jgi:predicted Co/Zn/Cd cation transporter (cation efflux family)
MLDYTNIDVMAGIGVGVLATGGVLLGVLSWLGSKMYDKLISIEDLFMTHLTVWTDKFSSLDSRVARLEVRVDNIKEICTAHHNNRP